MGTALMLEVVDMLVPVLEVMEAETMDQTTNTLELEELMDLVESTNMPEFIHKIQPIQMLIFTRDSEKMVEP